MPPIVLALTYIDQLSPRAEWAPPYDPRDEGRPKSKRILEAMTHVTSALDIVMEKVAPICVRDATNPSTDYGIEKLWELINAQMNEARATKIARIPISVFELENSPVNDLVAYSLWKVLCVRASLRVVFCYRQDASEGRNWCGT
jgi:predicted GTPase